MTARFATLTFEHQVAAPVGTLWQAWTAPTARAVWAAPTPSVTVDFLEADTRVGGREVSICKVEGQADIRCEVGWLDLQPARSSVNSEMISSEGATQSAALVTAEFSNAGEGSRVVVTVQLASLAEDMEAGYRQGFGAGMDNLTDVARRTMILQRIIKSIISRLVRKYRKGLRLVILGSYAPAAPASTSIALTKPRRKMGRRT